MDGARKTQGFALMIVVSMLTVVSSLIVGFALLSSLENKKINNILHSPALIAKQNALRALHEALAKLQAASGQDTVATAKADILGVAENKHWVGVWKVNKCDEKIVTAQDQKLFLTWLVSGNYDDESGYAAAIDAAKRIDIINPEYKNIDPVYVQLVDADGDRKGQYAYWIDDQSLKIQGNIYDSGNSFRDLFSTSSRTSGSYRYIKKQCQGKYGLSMVEDYANCPLTQTFLNGHKNIQGEMSYTNLLDSSEISDVQKQYLQNKFHDLTNLSLGLLTDTRNGGFRKNLRHKSTGYLSEIPNNAFIFEPPTTYPAPPTTWEYLKSFVDINTASLAPRATLPLYRPQSGVNYSDCKMSCTTDENGYTTGTISGTNSGDLGIATQHGLYPIWVEFKNRINFYYNNGWGKPGWYSIELGFRPGFSFENPYVYNLLEKEIKVWYAAPYVQNSFLEDSAQRDRYQKFPTFRTQFLGIDNTSMGNYLFQDGPNNDFTSTNMFPFGETMIDQHMRPILDCYVSTSFPKQTQMLFQSGAHGNYTDQPKDISLQSAINNITGYYTRNFAIYQDSSFKTTAAQNIIIESFPSNNSPWNDKSISADPWDHLCLRISDYSSKNIMQQISDISMNPTNLHRNYNIPNPTQHGDGHSLPLWIMHSEIAGQNQYSASSTGIRPLVEGNPRASMVCRSARQDDMTSPTHSAHLIPGNWSWSARWDGICDPNYNTNVSLGNDALLNFSEHSEFRNLFDLPESGYKLFNLGFLQHMNAGCFSYHPTYAFGNSYQNPHIHRDRFFQENDDITGSTWPSHCLVEMLYDYSYCLNRILWDSCFIASNNGGDGFCLLNHRQKAFIGATQNSILSFKDAGENMAIHGAFNINSTSVNAWTAFLGGAAGNFTGNESHAEYSRIQTIDSTSNVGMCQLDATKIQSLAGKIVEQIKWRGIAGSIGEFVNRKLIGKDGDTKKLGLKGALQAAIDGTTINGTTGGTEVKSNRNKTWFDDEAASGPFWACKPGYLTQADILQSVGTALCARGDTFCIYAYGNALDKNGTIEAETRCEAIVQRLPELLDPSKPELGRRYKILAIKWITPPPLTINLPISDSIFSNFNESNAKAQTMWAVEGFLFDNTGSWSSVHWAIAGYGEGIAKSLTTFSSDIQTLSIDTAATKLAQNINSLNNINSFSTMKSLLSNAKNDSKIGASVSAFLDAYNATIAALSGTLSVANAQEKIGRAMEAIGDFTNSSEQNKTDYENSINALQAAFDYTEQNGNNGSNSSMSSQHANIKTAFTDALNGSSYASNGTKMANLTVALSSLENALSAYQNAMP